MARALASVFQRLGLRFPALFVILLTVTVVDLIVPDIIPFVDEIVLAALTALFGLWRDRRAPGGRPRDPDPKRAA